MADPTSRDTNAVCPTCGRPGRTNEITERRLILGEGKDEVVFFEALLKHEGIGGVQVMDYGGKTKLAKGYMQALRKVSGFGELLTLGVTRDANGAVKDAKAAIDQALGKAGLKEGDGPAQPRVLVLVVQHAAKGMLEDVCLASLAGRPELECVDKYLACCVEKGQPGPSKLAKARMHAWLAGKEMREYHLGRAAQQMLLDLSHSAFDPLRVFVREVAGVPER